MKDYDDIGIILKWSLPARGAWIEIEDISLTAADVGACIEILF